MLILSRVCAEFHDKSGAVLFAIRPADRMSFIEAPESIRQDPLFEMLLSDGSLETPTSKADQKKLENDPEKKPEKAEETVSAAPAEAKASGRKNTEKKEQP